MSSGNAKDGRVWAVMLAVALAGALGATPARAEEDRARRGFWMPGAFLSVETRSAADILGAVSDMIDAVKPGVGRVFRAQIAQGLQIGGVDGLDLVGGRQPAGLLVLNPRRQEGHVVVALGDSGVQAILRAIGGAMGQEVDEDLIDFGDFVIGEGDTVLYFRHSAPWLLCSLAPTALDVAVRTIKEGHAPRAPEQGAHVALHLDMKELRAAYGDVVAGWLQIGRTGLTAGGMQLQGPEAALGQLGIGILKEYINAAEAVFRGFDEIDLSVTLSGEAAEIEASALPAEDGVFAPLAKATEPATFAPASALPKDGTFVAAWRVDPQAAGLFVEAFARAGARISLGTDTLKEDDDETKRKLAHYRRLIGGFLAGEGASSVAMSPEGMSTVMATDAGFDEMRDLYSEITDIVTSDLAPLFQAMGFGIEQRYEKNVRRLAGGGSVDRVTATYEFPGVIGNQMKPMFDLLMGGNEQVTEIGDAGASTIVGWGRDSAKALDEAVARQREAADFAGAAWPAASKELRLALERARGVTTGAFEVRMGGYLAMILSMMKAQPGMGAFIQVDDEEIANLTKNDAPIVGWAGARDGRLVLYERVPTAGVKNMVEFIEKMQQRTRQRFEGGRDEWGPEPGPDDPVEVW